MRAQTLLATLLLSAVITSCTTASGLSVEQKAAKLLIVGVIGTSLEEGNPIIEDIEQRGITGVILFENNISGEGDSRGKLKQFVDDMQRRAPYQLLVSIDQEGGRVNRLKSKYGFADMPSQLSVGESGDVRYAREVARLIAGEVSSVGVNVNFTPCVDLNTNTESPAIGAMGRPFSDSEDEVTKLANIYIEEHHRQGVITSLKHFPGHGSAKVDSHLGLTDITNTWDRSELEPYRRIIESGECDMVMVSHLFHREVDSQYPATLSSKWIDGILRGELGWDGVVVSDDMQMRAITDEYGFEEAVTRGFNAGIDLFIFSRYSNSSEITKKFIDVIVRGVECGDIAQSRLDEAVARIEGLSKGGTH